MVSHCPESNTKPLTLHLRTLTPDLFPLWAQAPVRFHLTSTAPVFPNMLASGPLLPRWLLPTEPPHPLRDMESPFFFKAHLLQEAHHLYSSPCLRDWSLLGATLESSWALSMCFWVLPPPTRTWVQWGNTVVCLQSVMGRWVDGGLGL